MSASLRNRLLVFMAALTFTSAVAFIARTATLSVPAETPPSAAPAPALVVRVSTSPQGIQVSGLLLTAPDRVPAQAQDRVYALDPGENAPLSWRTLLSRRPAVSHV